MVATAIRNNWGSKQIEPVLKKWPVTMLIIVLQALEIYFHLDALFFIEFLEYIGEEKDYICLDVDDKYDADDLNDGDDDLFDGDDDLIDGDDDLFDGDDDLIDGDDDLNDGDDDVDDSDDSGSV